MRDLKTKLLIGFITITALVSSLGTPNAFAAEKINVKIVGSSKTIFSGDVSVDNGCNVKDESNILHTYTSPVAVCALDLAAKTGNFSYGLKDSGAEIGLSVDQINDDKNSADLSTAWVYDVNGQPSQQGISNLLLKDGDSLFFHFTNPNPDSSQPAVNSGISYLKSQQNSDGSIKGFTGINTWAAIAFSAAGTVNDSLTNYLSSSPPATGSAATDWEKYILAITAAGKNPFDFGGVNYEAKLETFNNNSQLGSSTQINDDIFGLLALIASGPNVSANIKQNCLNFIIAHQNNDGGFSWSTTGTSDTDDTAAALQSLVAANNNGMSATGLTNSIAKATIFLLSEQKNDGGFVSITSDTNSNTATTSWAVMALSALGMTNDDKTKNALNFIKNNQQKDGSFAWQAQSAGETFTTSYAITALKLKSWPIEIFNQNISETPTPTPTPTFTPTPTATQTLLETDLLSTNETPTPTIISVVSQTAQIHTVLGINTNTGLKNSNNKLNTSIKNSQKNFQEIKKQNISFFEQIQKLFQEINKRIKLLFHL